MNYPTSSRTRAADFRKRGADASSKTPSSNGKASLKKETTRRYVRDYVRWLWPYRWTMAGILLLAILTAGLDMIWPLAIKRVIDLLPRELPQAEKLHQLHVLGFAIIAILVLKQVFDSLRSFRTTV